MTDVDTFPRATLEPRIFEPVARADTDSWVAVVADVIRFAEIIADTDFVPKGLRGSAPATAAAMMYGREVGLPPMTSLSSTHVVDGRPAISAEAMRALVLAAGHEIAFDTMTGAECTMRGRRRGSDQWTSVSWTLAMARAAKIDHKDNWVKYPRAMLVARATAELCRLIFPDVVHGFAAVEEAETLDAPVRAEPPAAGGPGRRAPVRRRSGRVASERQGSRPVADEPPTSPRPVGPGDLPPLPGEPGFEDDDHRPVARTGATDEEPAGGDTLADASSPAATVVPSRDAAAGEDRPPADEPAPVAPETVMVAPRMGTRAQVRMIVALFGDLDIPDRDERLAVTSTVVGRDVASANDLSFDEAAGLIDTLGRIQDKPALMSLVDHIRQAELPPDQDGETPR